MLGRIHKLISALVAERLPPLTPASSATVAIESVATASVFEEALKEFKNTESESLNIHECIRIYREMMPKSTSRSTHAVFGATLGAEQLDNPESSQSVPSDKKSSERRKTSKSEEQKKCVCGRRHFFSKCYYLNSSIAPEQWKPHETTQARIIANLKGNAKLKDKISSTLKKASVTLPEW